MCAESSPVPAFPAALPPGLDEALRAALTAEPLRILAIDCGGARYWLKRPETYAHWYRRVQKGDPRRALEADRRGLEAMAARGLPAPRLLAAGPDYLLLEDGGRPVSALLRDPEVPAETRVRAIRDAARALAAVHRTGLSHGRPKARDILWTPDRGAVLTDFETFRENAGAARIGRDVVVFLHSVLDVRRGRDGCFDAAATSYRAAAPDSAWQAAKRTLRRTAWLLPLARLVLLLSPGTTELQAMLELSETMRRLG